MGEFSFPLPFIMLKGSAAFTSLRASSKAVEPSTLRAGYAMSPLLDFRRQRLRQGWKTPDRPDALSTVFPNIRHGRDYDLNWEFNSYKITPEEDAYRNLHLRGLQMLVPGKSDKQKAIHVKTDDVPDHQIYYVSSDNVQVPEKQAVPSSAWKSAIRLVRMDLSYQPSLFMVDSRIGSTRSSSVSTRLMFNSPSLALHLHMAMPAVSRVHPSQFEHEITGYLLETDNVDKFSEGGVSAKNFTIVDLERRSFLTVGKLTPEVVRKSLWATASNYLAAEKESLVLKCDAVLHGNDTGLIFNINTPPASEKGGLDLFSARETIWGPHGLSRAWDSVTTDHVPSSVKRGDVVENGTRHTSKVNKVSFKGVAPKIAVFLASGKDAASLPAISKMKDAAHAIQFYSQHGKQNILTPTANQEEFYQQLQKKLTESNTACYVVNYQNANNLPQLLEEAFSGVRILFLFF